MFLMRVRIFGNILALYGFKEKVLMNKKEKAKSFVDSEIYKDKFEELLSNRKIMLIMVCNNIVLRINHIYSLYKSYVSLRSDYTHAHPMYSEDFLLAEEIVYHIRKAIDEMIYSLWTHKVGISHIDDSAQNKCIDSIGKYLNQDVKMLTEFDDYLKFIQDINALSNTYKHSICTFSPIETDLSCNEEAPSFLSYAVREKDPDVKIIQDDLLNTVDKIFDRFLASI